MSDPSLFDCPADGSVPEERPQPSEAFATSHSRRSDPPSSKKAARRVSLHADSQCGKIHSILREGRISGDEFYARARNAGIKNPRARVSDLRKWGISMHFEIKVDDDGFYELIYTNTGEANK